MTMKKYIVILLMGLVVLATSCGQQHQAQGLVKDFLNENLNGSDCSFERFSRISQTAMIDANKIMQLRKEMANSPNMKRGISYQEGDFPDTLLYIRATYKLTDINGTKQEFTQTFYMDKELTRIIAFKQN